MVVAGSVASCCRRSSSWLFIDIIKSEPTNKGERVLPSFAFALLYCHPSEVHCLNHYGSHHGSFSSKRYQTGYSCHVHHYLPERGMESVVKIVDYFICLLSLTPTIRAFHAHACRASLTVALVVVCGCCGPCPRCNPFALLERRVNVGERKKWFLFGW
jgi:hypothetical protein